MTLDDLARSRERSRMVRSADGDAPEAISEVDKAVANEFAGYLTLKLSSLVAQVRDHVADPFAVRGAVLRQMLADYEREREAMEQQQEEEEAPCAAREQHKPVLTKDGPDACTVLGLCADLDCPE